MDINDAKAKVAKLLAMADPERGGSDQEVETALRHAEAIMLKHGISMADLDSKGQAYQFNWETGFYPFGRDGKPTTSNPKWFGWLAVAVANFTDTIVVQSVDTRLGYGVSFKGDQDDMVFALWLIAYLKDAIRKATRDEDLGSSHARETFRKSMALGLVTRMTKLRADRQQTFAATGTALIVVNDKIEKRNEFFGGPQYKEGRGVKLSDQGAAGKGYAAAQKVQFNRPLAGTSNTAKLRG